MTLLSERLRLETRDLHVEVERSPFMQRILKGPLSDDAYRRYLTALAEIYEALEDSEHVALILGDLDWSVLARAPRLRADLEALGGPLGREPEVEAYARGLVELRAQPAPDGPARLAGHAYCRYLGDLFGGQTLARLLEQRHGVSAVRFYTFTEPAGELVLRFRAALDAVPEAQAPAVLEGALEGFRRHGLMFEALERSTPAGAPALSRQS